MWGTYCSVEQTEADTTEENSEEPVEDKEYRQGSKEGIPEPEYEVDLLVDDILEQDKWITPLQCNAVLPVWAHTAHCASALLQLLLH